MKFLSWLFMVVILACALGACDKACSTGERMADQTVFNADKHVWTYEEFYRKYEAYQQYAAQIGDAQTALTELETKGVSSGQRYDNLSNEIDGARQMMRRIAAEYNKMSDVAYQGIWKSKGLPNKLGE